jgi:hypothetical protein
MSARKTDLDAAFSPAGAPYSLEVLSKANGLLAFVYRVNEDVESSKRLCEILRKELKAVILIQLAFRRFVVSIPQSTVDGELVGRPSKLCDQGRQDVADLWGTRLRRVFAKEIHKGLIPPPVVLIFVVELLHSFHLSLDGTCPNPSSSTCQKDA